MTASPSSSPLKKAGAYLVTAQMAGGNLSRILVWISDTVIVKKMLDKQSLYYVADAVSGEPIENAQVEFFGWKAGSRSHRMSTSGT